MIHCEGAHELDSKGMGVPGLDFQKFASRYNVIEVGYLKVAVHLITILAVRGTQPITKGQNFINNPCPINTMVTW